MKDLVPLPLRQFFGSVCTDWKARRQKERLLAALRGDAVQCNVCGWQGARFADDRWHRETVCPVCRLQVRHRMLAALLDGLADIDKTDESSLLGGKDVLHFAPERQLSERFRKTARKHVTADFDRSDCDLRVNMSCMPEVADASFDTVIACDVLEHVPDDIAAMRELRRILRSDGLALVTVPQKDSPSETDEDSSVTDEAQRIARFGQKDHVRMYGDDFAERLESAGFRVRVISASTFSSAQVERHVLKPPWPNPHPLATNQRRIYLALAV
jgi:hypothetical protein